MWQRTATTVRVSGAWCFKSLSPFTPQKRPCFSSVTDKDGSRYWRPVRRRNLCCIYFRGLACKPVKTCISDTSWLRSSSLKLSCSWDQIKFQITMIITTMMWYVIKQTEHGGVGLGWNRRWWWATDRRRWMCLISDSHRNNGETLPPNRVTMTHCTGRSATSRAGCRSASATETGLNRHSHNFVARLSSASLINFNLLQVHDSSDVILTSGARVLHCADCGPPATSKLSIMQ